MMKPEEFQDKVKKTLENPEFKELINKIVKDASDLMENIYQARILANEGKPLEMTLCERNKNLIEYELKNAHLIMISVIDYMLTVKLLIEKHEKEKQ